MNAQSSRSHAIFTMYITHRRAAEPLKLVRKQPVPLRDTVSFLCSGLPSAGGGKASQAIKHWGRGGTKGRGRNLRKPSPV
jgi:hypothetical protein